MDLPQLSSSTLREQVRQRVAEAVAATLADGGISVDQQIELVRPGSPEHGDFSTNIALKLAGALRRPPRQVGDAIAARLAVADDPLIERVEVAGPGFVNFWLRPEVVEAAVDDIRAAGLAYGRAPAATGRRINVEFVSANPTGPLHVGNARGAFVGDVLSRVLEAAGHAVTREYYFNDFGSQVKALGGSIRALRLGAALPEDGYRGAYVVEMAADVPAEVVAAAEAAPDADAADWIYGRWASEIQRAGIERSLAALGIGFDVWKTESSIHDQGWVQRGVEALREAGYVYEQEGATWFRSTDFGDDKDRVIYRANGAPTYFAADIGYIIEKLSRGFDELIYVWGENHHGAVARLVNAGRALGHDADAVRVLLYSWVRFVREGEPVSMSKRSGEFVTLDDLMSEVGVDAARWFFAARSPQSGIDFDIELARRESNENPVFYVQYAHARISSIVRRAAADGLATADSLAGRLRDDPISLQLANELLRLPEVIADAAAARETHAVTAYATELATMFHAFYRDRRVVDPSDPATSANRLALVDATRITLASALALLGISAPESM
jgi:arginyl-tRNA synthetase